MKTFFKQVLAVVVGMLIVSAFTFLMGFIMLGAMLSAGDSKPVIKDGSVLRINLSGNLQERVQANPVSVFLGMSGTEEQGLDNILKSIKIAATNDKISGIYLESGIFSADMASLEEIRKALTDFKKSGKFIIAYGDSYLQGAYYVASVADSLYINPSGMLDWHGIASQPMFYKELLEKVGVKMQVFRVGTFKSAVEPFIRTDMSDANRAMVQSFINDIWTVACKDVSASRKSLSTV